MTRLALYLLSERGLFPIAPAPGARGLADAFDHIPAGVYSGLRTFHGRRFLRLDLHIARTRASIRALGAPDFDESLLRRGLDEAARAFGPGDARVRFDVLPEPCTLEGLEARMVIGLEPFVPVPAELLASGVRVLVASGLERRRPRVKTTEFVRRRRPYPLGSREAFEHLMVDGAGRILEGTSSNFFGLRGGELRTAGEGVLEGVTRSIVLDLARALDLGLSLEAPKLEELAELEEAFLSSSSRGLVPIVAVGEQRIGEGGPGPCFARLLAAYLEYAEREARPAVG